jgi:hypothetical protein
VVQRSSRISIRYYRLRKARENEVTTFDFLRLKIKFEDAEIDFLISPLSRAHATTRSDAAIRPDDPFSIAIVLVKRV